MIINQATLQGIYKSFSTIFNEAFEGAASMWDLVAMLVMSAGRSVDYKWLGNVPMMREWVGDRIIADLEAFSYEIVNKDYESTVEVDRNDLEDDQIGIYQPIVRQLGETARQHPDLLVWALLKAGFDTLCFDGQNFFDTDHPIGDGSVSNDGGGSGDPWFLMDLSRAIKPIILQRRKNPEFVSMDDPRDENAFLRKKFRYGVDDRKNVGYGLWQLAYGSKDTLDEANYAAARAAIMSFKNDEDVPLGIVPTHLVVPPTLESAGRQLLKVMTIESATPGTYIPNPWFESAELVVVPWLA